jgi:hypothetical protein
MKYERLAVLERVKKEGQSNAYCRCLCDCGIEKIVRETHLKSGAIKSCGCLSREIASKNNSTHGERKTRLYSIWTNMKSRCYVESYTGFHKWGGRGIAVCDEWRNSYGTFRTWALLNGYNDNLTLDRIDNNGDYAPENCRWVSMKQQNRNRRNTTMLEHNGEVKSLSEWSEITGIPMGTLRYRISTAKWPISKALETPVLSKSDVGKGATSHTKRYKGKPILPHK